MEDPKKTIEKRLKFINALDDIKKLHEEVLMRNEGMQAELINMKKNYRDLHSLFYKLLNLSELKLCDVCEGDGGILGIAIDNEGYVIRNTWNDCEKCNVQGFIKK